MRKTRNKILIIDGNNLLYRAYNQYKSMSYKGKSSSIIFGFPYILRSQILLHKPDEVLVVFDGGRSKERKNLLPTYKQKEKRSDFNIEDFISQKETLKLILDCYGIPHIEHKGTEADDIIWLYVRRLKRFKENKHIVILTTDKDYNQFISNKVSIWNPWKGIRITYKNCKNIFGYEPEQCVDFLVLTGDTSDNIPGLPGIGPVRAMNLLNKYGTIEDYLLNGEEEKLFPKKELESIYLLNRQLIDIRLFCRRHLKDIKIELPNKPKKVNKKELAIILSDYGVKHLLKTEFIQTFKDLL